VVAWNLGRDVTPIGAMSGRRTAPGVPLVVLNIGAGVREEDIRFKYAAIGQYRLPAAAPLSR
jgi:uncharacterized protein YijF (DUF1287 family)